MKKIFTLFLTLFILSSAAFSQPFIASVNFRTPAVSFSFGKRYVETYSYTTYEREMQISKINAAYNQQVREAMNLRISASKKIDLIQQLQRERSNKIQNANERFFDYRNKHNYNHYDRNYNWIR
jgi:hypothetical protein